LPLVALELLGRGTGPGHHRRLLGDGQIRMPRHAKRAGQAIEPFDRGVHELGIGHLTK
jgi:hypothetical protein